MNMETHITHNCKCDICRDGLEAVEKRENAAMKQMGWYAHYCEDDPEVPFKINMHTHGLEKTFNHLNLQICAEIPAMHAHRIFITVIEEIKGGKKFEHGKLYDNIIEPNTEAIEKYKVLFLDAEENQGKVLRLIFPAPDGRFDNKFSLLQMVGCSVPSTLNLF